MHDYYYRGPEEEEVIIQAAGPFLSIRVSEEDDSAALAMLPAAEIDAIIAGLQVVKRKLASRKSVETHTLDYFLSDPTTKNAYVEAPGFESLYVRKGPRYLSSIKYEDVVDIANATATRPGQGALTALITRLHSQGRNLYMESVLNERLVPKLLRMGFTMLPDIDPPCLYLLATDTLKVDNEAAK